MVESIVKPLNWRQENASLSSSLQALREENERLRTALQPFADMGLAFVKENGEHDNSPWASIRAPHGQRDHSSWGQSSARMVHQRWAVPASCERDLFRRE
jgi:hypothetical protein